MQTEKRFKDLQTKLGSTLGMEVIDIFGINVFADLSACVGINLISMHNHGFAANSNRNDLVNQVKLFEQNGWKLICVFEDDLINRFNIVVSRCLNALGRTPNRIFARKCQVVDIEKRVGAKFINENHIQGTPPGAFRYSGLMYNGNLVSVASVGRARFSTSADYELLRFASLTNHQVVGGASKILNHLFRDLEGGIVSYADRRYGAGEVYSACGFQFSEESSPCYWYYKPEHPEKKWHRSAFQKHKLPKLLETFDIQRTELDNMKENGYFRIFDAGNMVFLRN